jgi:hypothetical protein
LLLRGGLLGGTDDIAIILDVAGALPEGLTFAPDLSLI